MQVFDAKEPGRLYRYETPRAREDRLLGDLTSPPILRSLTLWR